MQLPISALGGRETPEFPRHKGN